MLQPLRSMSCGGPSAHAVQLPTRTHLRAGSLSWLLQIRERLEAEGVRDGRGRAPEFHVYGAYARKEDMALSRPDVGRSVGGGGS